MSKMDNLRALREARYEQEAARGAKASGATRRTTQAAASPTGTKQTGTKTGAKPTAAKPAAAAPDGLCGHRSMNGRSCTREQGHAAKSHRYS